MKFGNKKLIQKLYREQMREKREQEINYVEMIFLILIVAVLLAFSQYLGV